MNGLISIRPYEASDYKRVLDICVSAFTPIHQGYEKTLGTEIFSRRYHDWQAQYAHYLKKIRSDDPAVKVYVVEEEDVPVAFIFTIMDHERKIGEIDLNAVALPVSDRGLGR